MFHDHFIARPIADPFFHILHQGLDWERRDNTPRYEYWTNSFNRDYTYGKGNGQRTYQAKPLHPVIKYINEQLAEEFKLPLFEGCFLNLYGDGTDALGWHADDDPSIDHTRPIAVVTLGQGRRIEWKSNEAGSHPEGVLLTPGSAFLMPAGFQQTHYHRIPKANEDIGPRISLTYRGLI